MANSLRSKLSKLRYKGEITQEEYSELIKKLDGHDSELLDKVAYRINQRKESNKICLQNALHKNDEEDARYFRNLLFEDDLVTDIIAEMKAEIKE